MRRVAYLRAGAIATALCVGAVAARAQEASDATNSAEPVELEETKIDDLSPIADAHAQVAAVLAPTFDPFGGFGQLGQVLAYAGIDGWRYGGSLYVGSEWSPSERSPFVLRLFASDGLDDFRTRSTTYRSETARASVLPGLHLQAEKLDIKLLAGGDYMLRIPLRPAFETPIQIFGARATVDVWWEPAEQWMLSGSASATTIEAGLSGRLAAGWRLPLGWIGPEVLATRDTFNSQVRAGAHLTGLKIGATEWAVAGGYSRDSFGRGGPYGRLGFTLRP